MQPQNQEVFSFSKILLAGVLTLAFLSVYTYFFPQDSHSKTTQATQETSKISAPQPSPTISANAPTQEVSALDDRDVLVKVNAEKFDLEIDSLGRIKQVYLKDKRFLSLPKEGIFEKLFGERKQKEVPKSLPLFDPTSIRPLEVRFADPILNEQAFKSTYTASDKNITIADKPVQVTLTQKLGDFVFKKILTIKPDLSYTIEIQSSDADKQYFISNGARPVADADAYVFLGTIIDKKDGKLENLEEGDAEGVKQYEDSIFVASVDRYFGSVLFSRSAGLDVVVDGNIKSKSPIAFAQFKGDANIEGYIGEKNYQKLKAIYAPLGDMVEYGMVTFFAKPLFLLLEILYKVCGNWGWAIVLLTIVVRLVLFPLSYKGMLGMQKLKEIAPEMKEIQTKYKNDPQKMQKHIMELYRKNGANPLGGCLPLLLQIPVFFAIYKVLYCAVELKSAPWVFWIVDLSAIDPYYVLPLIMGATMYITQTLTPSNFTDATQEKVFKMLPLFFTIFFIIFPFPAGLVLYWSVNNVISIIQQIVINKVVEKQKGNKK